MTDSRGAKSIYDAARYMMDQVYTRISDLDSVEKILSADLYHHHNCYKSYLRQHESLLKTSSTKNEEQSISQHDKFTKYIPFITAVVEKGHGISLSEIRTLCADDGFEISNKYIKMYLIDEFGDTIQFLESHRKNESQFVFSANINVNDVVNILHSQDTITDAATKVRKSFFNLDFGLDNKLCDSEELQQSWYKTNIPDELISFFSVLFNVKKTTFLKHCVDADHKEEDCEDDDNDDEDDIEEQGDGSKSVAGKLLYRKVSKMKSMIQIPYYAIQNGRKKNTTSCDDFR